MRKIIKKWGEGLGIYFDKEDVQIYGLKEGEILDLDDMLVQGAKKKVKDGKN